MGSQEQSTKILLSLGNISANDQANHQTSKKKGHAKVATEEVAGPNQQSLSSSPNFNDNPNSHSTYQKKPATK